MRKIILLFISFSFFIILNAQHHHQQTDSTTSDTSSKEDLVSNTHSTMNMPSAFSRNLPMNVNGSGTSWHPVNSPMYMNMFHKNGWNFMFHYGVFISYTNQNVNRASTQRGGSSFYSSNWAMLMANKLVGNKGLFMVRGMFSGEPLTIGGQGYPLLFATGESWNDKPLIDHQHPHDLISELSVGYSHAFTKNIDLYVYAGMPGEPSIGPPAFMHRPSALNIPTSPVGHHWQDATHITFGVATVGVRYKYLKLESSSFTGREPNENRYNFDKPRFDSYSGRVSVNPGKALALQASYGNIKSPETLFPDVNVEKYSASVLHNYWFSKESVVSTAVVWGMNTYHHHMETFSGHSLLLESNLQTMHYSFFTRLEFVQKDNHELEIDSENEHHKNDIGVFMLGASKYILKNSYFWIDAGVLGTAYTFSNSLNSYYGRQPYSVQLFIRVIPPRMSEQ